MLGIARNDRLQIVQAHTAWRIGRAQQRHGLFAQDRRPLRDDRPAGQREFLSDLFRRPSYVGRRPIFSLTGVSLGVRADRQLRLPHRAGRLLAVADPRGRTGQEIFDRGGSSRQEDPCKILARSSEPLVRPEPSEREGYVPNVVYTCGAMRHRDQIIFPMPCRHILEFCDDKDIGVDAGGCALTAASARAFLAGLRRQNAKNFCLLDQPRYSPAQMSGWANYTKNPKSFRSLR